jgi:hypothetical protein
VKLFANVRAQLRRRLLVTYRVDPTVAAALVPAPFRPQLVDGSAVAGICLIGFEAMRPGWFGPRIGLRSENVAHRIAVEWDEESGIRTGVYIFGRHTSSLLPVLGGGRLFPGVHRRGRITVDETVDRFRITLDAPDSQLAVDIEARLPWKSDLFPTLEAASDFYRGGPVGWSPRIRGDGVEALELVSQNWAVEPGYVHSARSSFFDSLPPGSAVLDSALVMRDLPLVWETPKVEFRETVPA